MMRRRPIKIALGIRMVRPQNRWSNLLILYLILFDLNSVTIYHTRTNKLKINTQIKLISRVCLGLSDIQRQGTGGKRHEDSIDEDDDVDNNAEQSGGGGGEYFTHGMRSP